MRRGHRDPASSSSRGRTPRARGARLRWLLAFALAAASSGPGAALAATPAITSISPNNGPEGGGTAVTISGRGIGAGSSVSFGGTPARVLSAEAPSTITVASPPGSGTVGIAVDGPDGSSAEAPADRFAYDGPPSEPWLGLDGNNTMWLGPVGEFVDHGIVFDRSGPVEWTAGQLATEHGAPTAAGAALTRDLAEGMIPVVTIEYRGYRGDYRSDPLFPSAAHGSPTLAEYVAGFVASASSILRTHPRSEVLFEPINEPWGYTTPQFDGREYGEVIARLLPAARRAHLPLASIYVGAYGRGWVSQMYAARPALRSEVEGWYLHPYGPANGSLAEARAGIGMRSVPVIQAEMTSGQSNIIISEAGFCALSVNGGRACGEEHFAHGREAADALHELLLTALGYHEEGWLRALLLYSRNDGGWAMELPRGVLTEQGRTLLTFADSLDAPAGPLPPATASREWRPCLPPLADAIVAGRELFVGDGLTCSAPLSRGVD